MKKHLVVTSLMWLTALALLIPARAEAQSPTVKQLLAYCRGDDLHPSGRRGPEGSVNSLKDACHLSFRKAHGPG